MKIHLASGLVRLILARHQPWQLPGEMPQISPTVLLNTKVQGNAAAGIKFGILEAKRRGLDTRLGATVHDELIGVVEDKWAAEYGRELQESMIVGMGKVVGCTVRTEVAIGRHWSK
jgi:DNA polymerase I-like protein with 3'-5' exonuclease and polymerase domains